MKDEFILLTCIFCRSKMLYSISKPIGLIRCNTCANTETFNDQDYFENFEVYKY